MVGWLDVQTTLVDDSTKKTYDRRGVDRISRLRAEEGGTRDAKEGIPRACVNRGPTQYCFAST